MIAWEGSGTTDRRRAARIRTIDDARRRARLAVPATVFDYVDGGAGAETTMRANREALLRIPLLPKLGVTHGTPPPDLRTTLFGQTISLPVLLAPVGFTRMMHRRGDVAAAEAAGAAGTVHTLSTFSGHTLEEVAKAATGPLWFQLYFLGGRAGAEALVCRAKNAGYRALVVTLDTQTVGFRERDARHGVKVPLKVGLGNVLRFAPEAVMRPSWLLGFAKDRFNIEMAHSPQVGESLGMGTGEVFTYWGASPPRWEDFAWIREAWDRPIIVKGVLSADDARRAIDAGVDGIVVSNHGGRQLDGAPATITVLSKVVNAVADQAEVFVDGGFRRGSDVVRALALGAKAVMVGRPWAFGLSAAGSAGVRAVIELFRTDLDRVLRLLGCASVQGLDASCLSDADRVLEVGAR